MNANTCESNHTTTPSNVIKNRGVTQTNRLPSAEEHMHKELARNRSRYSVCGVSVHNNRSCNIRADIAVIADEGLDMTDWQYAEGMWVSDDMFGLACRSKPNIRASNA